MSVFVWPRLRPDPVHVIGEKHAVGRKQQRVAGRTEFALAEILGNIAEIDIHADNAEDISFVVADGAVFGRWVRP